MPSRFRPVSLLIETDLDRAALKPDAVLLHPAGHAPASSRVILHETLHYWQQLSQGFLHRLAAEDLARLEDFEAGRALAPPGPHRREYVRRYQPLGFSAHDLQEALARYWDVHVLGPPLLLSLERADPKLSWSDDIEARHAALEKAGRLAAPDGSGYSGEAYDLAMTAAAGRYARPYLLLLERMPSMAAAGMFPLIAHMAFQTSRPVPFFTRLIECAMPLFDPFGSANRDIEVMWKSTFAPAMSLALHLARILGEPFDYTPLLCEPEDPRLGRAIPYRWARHRVHVAADVLARREAGEGAAEPADKPGGTAAWELMLRLATPGIAEHRSFLSEWLSPPAIRFGDGECWRLGDVHRRMRVPEVDEAEQRLSAEQAMIAGECAALDGRWQAFVRAGLRQGYGSAPAEPGRYESAVYQGASAIARLAGERDPVLIEWLLQTMLPPAAERQRPLALARGWYFFVRATLAADPVRADDIDRVCAMLVMHLGGFVPSAEYDAETGTEWRWTGAPVETALAAEFCGASSERLGDVVRAQQCRAIELEALKSEAIARALSRGPAAETLARALAARIARLEAFLDDPRIGAGVAPIRSRPGEEAAGIDPSAMAGPAGAPEPIDRD